MSGTSTIVKPKGPRLPHERSKLYKSNCKTQIAKRKLVTSWHAILKRRRAARAAATASTIGGCIKAEGK